MSNINITYVNSSPTSSTMASSIKTITQPVSSGNVDLRTYSELDFRIDNNNCFIGWMKNAIRVKYIYSNSYSWQLIPRGKSVSLNLAASMFNIGSDILVDYWKEVGSNNRYTDGQSVTISKEDPRNTIELTLYTKRADVNITFSGGLYDSLSSVQYTTSVNVNRSYKISDLSSTYSTLSSFLGTTIGVYGWSDTSGSKTPGYLSGDSISVGVGNVTLYSVYNSTKLTGYTVSEFGMGAKVTADGYRHFIKNTSTNANVPNGFKEYGVSAEVSGYLYTPNAGDTWYYIFGYSGSGTISAKSNSGANDGISGLSCLASGKRTHTGNGDERQTFKHTVVLKKYNNDQYPLYVEYSAVKGKSVQCRAKVTSITIP